MKIEFDENDLDYIEKINKSLETGENMPLFIDTKGTRFFIEFTCEDAAKTDAFIAMFMNPNAEKVQELKDKFGIKVECFNYCTGDIKMKELKQYLQVMLQDLERM